MLTAWACLVGLAVPTFTVAPTGDDRADGSPRRPFATIGRALKAAEKGHAVIKVRAGRYRLESGLTLQADDVCVQGEPGAVITGAIVVESSPASELLQGRITPQALSEVQEVPLDRYQLKAGDFLAPRGFARRADFGPCEPFVMGEAQHLCQWPKTGYLKVGDVLHGKPDTKEPGEFQLNQTHPFRWKATDLWAFGYWKWDWADEAMSVKGLQNGVVSLADTHVYGFEKGASFRFENVTDELSLPGEYAIEAGRLFFLPSKAGSVEISLVKEPLLTVQDAKGCKLAGLQFENTRGTAVKVQGGSGTVVEKCLFRNTGTNALTIQGGFGHIVRQCRVEDTGEGGFNVNAGDRNTLTSSGVVIEDCVFTRFMRRAKTYRPAVMVNGVGVTVRRCDFSDAPHSAIIFGGNEHLIERCLFHDMLSETGDGGVVYGGRDWSAQGTVIRENLFDRIVGLKKWENCVYLDDQLSGIRVERNVFADSHWAMLIGGGQDNVVRGNVILNCTLAFSLDARGLGWAASSFDTMKRNLEAVPYQSDVWKQKYPNLADILKDKPMAPLRNEVEDNVLVFSGHVTDRLEKPFADNAKSIKNWESMANPVFHLLHGEFTVSDAAMNAIQASPSAKGVLDLKFGPLTDPPFFP